MGHQASHYRYNEAASGLRFRQPQPLRQNLGEAVERQIGLSEKPTKPRTKKGGDNTKTKQHLFEKYFSPREVMRHGRKCLQQHKPEHPPRDQPKTDHHETTG